MRRKNTVEWRWRSTALNMSQNGGPHLAFEALLKHVGKHVRGAAEVKAFALDFDDGHGSFR